MPLMLQPASPEARLSLPEAVAAGRTGLPPEGLHCRETAGGKVAHARVHRQLGGGLKIGSHSLNSPSRHPLFPIPCSQSTSGSEVVFPNLKPSPGLVFTDE